MRRRGTRSGSSGKADSDGWVTIGACDNEFSTILAVFTGVELGSLVQVAKGNADEGPDCLYTERQYTFEAKSGTKYVIAVDGNIFHLPESPTPVTEGEISLLIEKTPKPPNDDFDAATLIDGSIDEEPGGDRFYFGSVTGYNWGATTEEGEVVYGGGASVWYSWTAPESGRYRFSGPCCVPGLNWGLYEGDTVGALTQRLASSSWAEAVVAAGVKYRISVLGVPGPESEEPTMASFTFSISAALSPLPPPPDEEEPVAVPLPPAAVPSPDITPPRTRVFKRVKRRRRHRIVIVRFRSNEPGSTFRCKLNGRRWRRCRSPLRFRRPRRKRYVLRVVAVDPAGNRDRSPAVARFKIKLRQCGNKRRSSRCVAPTRRRVGSPKSWDRRSSRAPEKRLQRRSDPPRLF